MLALALLAALPISFHYDASEFTNTVYHINCLTARVPCTNAVFARFWNQEYHVTKADGAQLDTWLEILRKAENAAPAPPPAPLLPNYASFYPSMAARYRIVTTAVESHSPKEFHQRARKFLAPEDAARLTQVLDHFQRRLHPWWQANGRHAVEAHIRQVKRRMKKSELLPLAGQVAAFLDAKLPQPDVFIHAVPGPFPNSKDSSATVIANHFFVEITETDKPNDTIWKAMHELTHAFYDSAPPARHVKLMKEFVAAPEPRAPAFYTFLNEAVATAVQLLIYERLEIKDDDPYHHPYIPRLARSTLPLLKEALANHHTIFEGFADQYLRAGAEELREQTTNPKFILSSTAVLAAEKNQKASDLFFERMQPNFYLTTEKEWTLFTELNAVRFLTYDELPPFATRIVNLEALTKASGFAYVLPYNSKCSVFFLAGRDAEALSEVVKRLARQPSIPAEGLIFSVIANP